MAPGPPSQAPGRGRAIRFEGLNPLSRTIDFHGRQFNVQDAVLSEARLGYVYAGYQFDILARERGHLGFNFGGTFLDAEGTIAGINAGSRQTAPNCSACRWSAWSFACSRSPRRPGSASAAVGREWRGLVWALRRGADSSGIRRWPGYVPRRMGHPRRRHPRDPVGCARRRRSRITGPMVGVQVRFR